MAINHKDQEIREDFLQTSYECEVLVNKLAKLQSQILQQQQQQYLQTGDLQNSKNTNHANLNAISFGKQLQEKLALLGQKITMTLIQQVADDFIDINYPVRKLADVVLSSTGKFN